MSQRDFRQYLLGLFARFAWFVLGVIILTPDLPQDAPLWLACVQAGLHGLLGMLVPRAATWALTAWTFRP
ncbi:hypothetical protein [Deinococcus maricopensis]|uniref:Uncharacterized protein n=1 Tax=Deinococcus maricopensis (strain DSM 21211 / LMG 22137 / NRRL B-23946 / LB-34) TaxID=709986 RepID=E8U622_DEIML|nr:hypothetical protein [Deinococcus maricopensis]ADV66511.1 hypothetical protein Deima_0856 [Deinococcus maricopensis DSM 21211]